jgi:8-oxo-dGTP pyrophosphatase MutT (NUDIX family)
VKKEKLHEFGEIEYVFPGGRIEKDEYPADALQREVLIETGYDVDVVGQISFRVHPTTKKEIYYYHCKCDLNKQKTATSNEDIDSLLWVKIKEIGKYMSQLNPDIQRALLLL